MSNSFRNVMRDGPLPTGRGTRRIVKCDVCGEEEARKASYLNTRLAQGCDVYRCSRTCRWEDMEGGLGVDEQPFRDRFAHIKYKAKKRQLAFTLRYDDVRPYWKGSCYLCGEATPNLNLDRLNSGRGYEVGNVKPCCPTCNKMKWDLSLEDFTKRMEHILGYLATQD